MCGVFGFITKSGKGPDIARLQQIAVETQRRGHHAFGLAWLGDDGAIHTYKRPGPATANLGDLSRCRGAIALIGHCRWATHGDPRFNENNHPHPAGRGFFVHNGVVHNHLSLVRRYGFIQQSECDSEVLGLLMARFPGALGQRAARTAAATDGPLVILGLWRNPTRLLIVRNGNPLSFGETDGGYYFASLPEELPGPVTSINDRYAGVLTYERGDMRHAAYGIGK
jgi:glucosamine 6-phosphate synthetase-like amidotransferase/phosphosugar isomerase protein